jgi:hypothetical protein
LCFVFNQSTLIFRSTDPFVKFLLVSLGIVPSLPPCLKKLRGLLQQPSLSSGDLVRMHLELAGRLGRRLVGLNGCQAQLRLEG